MESGALDDRHLQARSADRRPGSRLPRNDAVKLPPGNGIGRDQIVGGTLAGRRTMIRAGGGQSKTRDTTSTARVRPSCGPIRRCQGCSCWVPRSRPQPRRRSQTVAHARVFGLSRDDLTHSGRFPWSFCLLGFASSVDRSRMQTQDECTAGSCLGSSPKKVPKNLPSGRNEKRAAIDNSQAGPVVDVSGNRGRHSLCLPERKRSRSQHCREVQLAESPRVSCCPAMELTGYRWFPW